MTFCSFCGFSAHLPEGWRGTGAGALFLCIIVVSTWPPSKGLRPLSVGTPLPAPSVLTQGWELGEGVAGEPSSPLLSDPLPAQTPPFGEELRGWHWGN